RHVPEVARNEFGTPLLNDIFKKAQHLAANDILCYVNADILLTNSLINAIDRSAQRFKRWVLVCAPINLEIPEHFTVASENWESDLRKLGVRQHPPTTCGADIFVFTRCIYHSLPPFAIGRYFWDNWIMGSFACRGIPVIDATAYVRAFHLSHEGSTHPYNARQDRPTHKDKDKEAKDNLRLTHWWNRAWRIDVPYYMTEDATIRSRYLVPVMGYYLSALRRNIIEPIIIGFLTKTYKIRRRMYLYRWWRYL
ncbi:MAG: hypothetical protein QXT26_06170, partial [Thermoproteota archaeon]